MGLALRSSLHTAKKLLGSPSHLWGRKSPKLPSWRPLALPSITPSAKRLLHQEAFRSPTGNGDQNQGSRLRRAWPFRSPPPLDISRQGLVVLRLSRQAYSGSRATMEVRLWSQGPQI